MSGGVAVFAGSEEEEESNVAEVSGGVEAGLVPSWRPVEAGELLEDARGNRPLPFRVRVVSAIGLEHVAEERSEKGTSFVFAWVLVNQPFDLRSNGQKGCRYRANSDGLTAGGKLATPDSDCKH